jgi:hypothetical protein
MNCITTPGILVACLLTLSGCISTPAPTYQAAIDNTTTLAKQAKPLGVGAFNAAGGVENKTLVIRGSRLHGGTDGTYATYLRDAVIAELKTANDYAESGNTLLSGVLTRNELATNIGTGKCTVGAEFSLSRAGRLIYKKTLLAEHEWESSFIGAIAIPAAINNYSTTVQQLLGKLFSDPDFNAAMQQP